MININKLILELVKKGYPGNLAEATVCQDIFIFNDSTNRYNCIKQISDRLIEIFAHEKFNSLLLKSNKNWLSVELKEVFNTLIYYIQDLDKYFN